MDAPRIQYAKTEDGVRIAYWTYGQGPPLLLMVDFWVSNVDLLWRQKWFQEEYEPISLHRTLIAYDTRGCGLSERPVGLITIEGLLGDAHAVLDRLKIVQFDLLASSSTVLTAAAFSKMYPGRIMRLILADPYLPAEGGDTLLQTLGQVRDQDFDTYSESIAVAVMGFRGEEARQTAELIRASAPPEMSRHLAAFYRNFSRETGMPLFTEIQAPTLVIRHTAPRTYGGDVATRLVAEMPRAELVVMNGTVHDTASDFADAVLRFLEPSRAAATEVRGVAAFRTILFTDLADHTAMMQRLGDAQGREVLREHERITREVLAAHGGTEVKAMGDGFMASFGSAQKALECAIALQRAFEARMSDDASVGAQRAAPLLNPIEPLRLHIGVNAGEPIAEEDDLFGASVILAARAASKAKGGQILVTNVVRELVAGKGFAFADRGEFEMKGFEEPVRLYEVQWR